MDDNERRPSVNVFVNGYPSRGLRFVGIMCVRRADVDEGCTKRDLLPTDAADPDARHVNEHATSGDTRIPIGSYALGGQAEIAAMLH
jgi:hypothetical protein